jgi:hypothetical protein
MPPKVSRAQTATTEKIAWRGTSTRDIPRVMERAKPAVSISLTEDRSEHEYRQIKLNKSGQPDHEHTGIEGEYESRLSQEHCAQRGDGSQQDDGHPPVREKHQGQ